jgi:hypothetical protein
VFVAVIDYSCYDHAPNLRTRGVSSILFSEKKDFFRGRHLTRDLRCEFLRSTGHYVNPSSYQIQNPSSLIPTKQYSNQATRKYPETDFFVHSGFQLDLSGAGIEAVLPSTVYKRVHRTTGRLRLNDLFSTPMADLSPLMKTNPPLFGPRRLRLFPQHHVSPLAASVDNNNVNLVSMKSKRYRLPTFVHLQPVLRTLLEQF